MTKITFTIPSVLNAGGGEKKTELEASTLKESFEKISEIMGDDFKRKVLEADGSPPVSYTHLTLPTKRIV